MKERRLSALFTWRSAIAESDLPPTTRLVAFTLSLHMSERGDSCFPSVLTLGAESGLGVTTVRRALRLLETEGYLRTRISAGGRTASGRALTSEYMATSPTRPERPGTEPVENDTNPAGESGNPAAVCANPAGESGNPAAPADKSVSSAFLKRHEDVGASATERETEPEPVSGDELRASARILREFGARSAAARLDAPLVASDGGRG